MKLGQILLHNLVRELPAGHFKELVSGVLVYLSGFDGSPIQRFGEEQFQVVSKRLALVISWHHLGARFLDDDSGG